MRHKENMVLIKVVRFRYIRDPNWPSKKIWCQEPRAGFYEMKKAPKEFVIEWFKNDNSQLFRNS